MGSFCLFYLFSVNNRSSILIQLAQARTLLYLTLFSSNIIYTPEYNNCFCNSGAYSMEEYSAAKE